MNDTTTRRPPVAAIAMVGVILAMWGIPRLLVAWLGIDGHWTPFLYQYAMGLLVFGVGLWVIRASGACDFDRPGDRRWFGVLVFGYLWYFGMHGLLTWLAVAVPFKGAGS
jgi:hypothetical protein